MRCALSLIAACGLAAALASASETVASATTARDVPTPQLGNAFANKVVVVQNHANAGAKTRLSTTFTQAETNSYLRFNATDLLPTGLTQPEITLHANNRVSAKAVVDLDIVRKSKSSGGWFDPTSYLTGKLPVTAAGRVITGDGKGRVELETAEVSGIPIPKSFLNQMVNFFTRTADNPQGSTVDDIFDLPSMIKSISGEQGKFTVHQ